MLIQGGRIAAEAALAAIDPANYARTRNFLDGSVTRLSPYLRHGVLTLAEVRDQALAKVRKPEDAWKFISELGWRDYWQRLYAQLGNDVWNDLEGWKTGYSASDYAGEMPEDLLEGTTGLECMDSFSHELRADGYLHNHARMWLASYLIHWRRVHWRAGARWFLEHLLDGDPASDNLSWQWVAGTFSHKAYFFNRENLEHYTRGVFCRNCRLQSNCPLDASYEDLAQRLFLPATGHDTATPRQLNEDAKPDHAPIGGQKPLLWIHTDSLNPRSDLFVRYRQTKACFVWDQTWLREENISAKRVRFLEQCLDEMPEPMERRSGDVAQELLKAVAEADADHIVAMRTVDPRLLSAKAAIKRRFPVIWQEQTPFVEGSGYNLKRFSRYWQRAQKSAFRSTNASHLPAASSAEDS